MTSEELLGGICEWAIFLGEDGGSINGALCNEVEPSWLVDCETLYGPSCYWCGWDEAPNKKKDLELATEIGRPCYLESFCQAYAEEAPTGCELPTECDGY